jgi:monoamine oxidase
LTGSTSAGVRTPKARSCIVIGAGLAGLAAAYRLTRAGWGVRVLESQQRLGGRVFSFRFYEARHLVCELGAEWIGADHHRMRGLCREFALPIERHQYAYAFWNGGPRSRFFKPGGWSFSKRGRRRYEAFGRTFRRLDPERDRAALEELDQSDWWTTLEGLGFTLNDRLTRDLMDSTDFGESIRLSSAYLAATEYFCSNKSDEMDFKIRGGNDRLINELAAAVRRGGGRVHIRSTVKTINQGPDGVELRLTDGRRYAAQYCICTTPAHCLNTIRWHPALPRDQQNAASQLQYSRIMKTAVLYANRFWRKERGLGFSVFTGRVSDCCFESTFRQKGPGGILCSYAIGDKADDLAREPNRNTVMRWITEDVASAIRPDPQIPLAPINMERQPWQREPWIGGAYAFYRPGRWFRVRPLLARPFGRVHFAGEHLSEDWQGFMEGAVQTGEAAADAHRVRADPSH